MGSTFLVLRIGILPSYTLRRRKTTRFGIIHSTTTNTCSISRATADASSPWKFHPIDDGFMSGSVDKTVRLWDLRPPTCRGLLKPTASPIVAYDSSGLVFAVGVNHYSRILLYDQANYDKDPFLTITLEDPTLALVSYPPRPIYMTSLSFSSNAKYILVGCSGDAHYILDAFEGHLLAKLEGHVGLERRRMDAPQTIDPSKGNSGEEVSWTPDSKYVVSGSLNGKIVIWDVQNLPVRSASLISRHLQRGFSRLLLLMVIPVRLDV
ncbi:WD40-repeat-containing domain protein [Suillus spraguei]|nr:WD40-repeat-containing domain protein [Suillus spraguei]